VAAGYHRSFHCYEHGQVMISAFNITCMEAHDDELRKFEASGAAPLPVTDDQGYVENDAARIWYSAYGIGPPVILLHGGLGQSGNWGYQVPALIANGYRAVVIDSRGHGRSTRDGRPYSYELLASDALAVMNALHLDRVALVGWSDGACTALVLAAKYPGRVAGVFFFACNMDPTGVRPFEPTPAVNRCFSRHAEDYKQLSATPEQFEHFVEDVGLMQRTQPNYSAQDLANISVPVRIAQSERDEFIKREHAEYLARTIPGASFIFLDSVSHFAPLQRPRQFNTAMLAFVDEVLRQQTDLGGSMTERAQETALILRTRLLAPSHLLTILQNQVPQTGLIGQCPQMGFR
jgi:pimeloyl-ACP methyl ester carboxylesterase